MAKSDVELIKKVIEKESNAEDKKILLKGLGDLIAKEEKDADAEYKSWLSGVKSSMFGTKKSAPKKKATPKKSAPKKSAKKDDSEDEIKKIFAKAGKTEEECEAILEEYAKARKAKAKYSKDRAEDLKESGEAIKGTTEKTASATIETAKKKVKEKVNQEEKAGKSIKVIGGKLLTSIKSLVKEVKTALGGKDKDEAKEFLLEMRAEIDKQLSEFGYGGMTQSYEIQWAGGGRPSSYGEGGRLSTDTLHRNDFKTDHEFIDKRVKVDFRKEEGVIVGIKELSNGNHEVAIHYPELGFTEITNAGLVEITFLDEFAKGGNILNTQYRKGFGGERTTYTIEEVNLENPINIWDGEKNRWVNKEYRVFVEFNGNKAWLNSFYTPEEAEEFFTERLSWHKE